MPRRLFALASALLMLNVSAAEALRVCASTASHAAVAVDTTMPASMHEHHAAPAPAPEDDSEKPCESPKPADCCAALSSCGVSLVIDAIEDDETVVPSRDASRHAVDRAPASQIFSPDPPPPRA